MAHLVHDYIEGHLALNRKWAGALAARRALERLLETRLDFAQFAANAVTRGVAFDILDDRKAMPAAALVTFDLLRGSGQRLDGQLFAISLRKRVIAQPMVSVVVAVEHRNHWLGDDFLDHANGHLIDLQGATRIRHHHASAGDHKAHVGLFSGEGKPSATKMVQT